MFNPRGNQLAGPLHPMPPRYIIKRRRDEVPYTIKNGMCTSLILGLEEEHLLVGGKVSIVIALRESLIAKLQ